MTPGFKPFTIIYQNIQSHKEKRTHISLDKNSNTEFYTDDILSCLTPFYRYTQE